jgi:hypothetical protein
MEKNSLGDGRMIPMDNQGLQDMLSAGPSASVSDVSPVIPDIPQVQEPAPVVVEPQAKASEAIEAGDGPDEDMKKEMILPSDDEKARLKAAYGMLRVVPIPYSREDGKIQTYILRQLTRSQWRTNEDVSRKLAENKPGVPPDEIFQEKIVAQAVVWPNLPEHQIAAAPAGLVPTLFGIVQQMGLFFNPEAIMAVSFTL